MGGYVSFGASFIVGVCFLDFEMKYLFLMGLRGRGD